MGIASAFAGNKKWIRTWLSFVSLLVLVSFPWTAQGRTIPQDQQKQALGSLSSVGDVFVNGSPAPAESTIFPGDTLRTGETGMATFTVSGQGSLKISPVGQVDFAATTQYVAELKSGSIVMTSSTGPSGIGLLAGKFIVVGVNRGEQSVAKVDVAANGASVITSLQGGVGILPRDQGEGPLNGRFLQAGQSVSISAQGQLAAPPAPANEEPLGPPTSGSSAPTPVSARSGTHVGWILIGAAGVGAAATAAILATRGGSNQTVSPSSP